MKENKICTSKQSCSDCIKAGPKCAWTDAVNYLGDRCQIEENIIELRNKELIKIKSMNNPKTKIIGRSENSELSFVTQQMFPFRYRVQIRPLDTINLRIKYKQLVDYPVDLYFLLDNSFTMDKYKEQLVKITEDLSRRLQEITKDYTIGYGSFVDKPLAPFTEPYQDKYPNK